MHSTLARQLNLGPPETNIAGDTTKEADYHPVEQSDTLPVKGMNGELPFNRNGWAARGRYRCRGKRKPMMLMAACPLRGE